MLEKILKKLKDNYILVLIILIGFAIRWYGIYFDYPRVNFIWDETYNISHLLEMFNNKTLFLERSPSPYPFLSTFLYFPAVVIRIIYLAIANGLYSVVALKNFILVEGPGTIHIVARWYSVIFGTATIFFVNRIFRFIYNDKLSLNFLTFAYSVSIIPVYLSHWGKVHIMMVFFFILTLYFTLNYEEGRKSKYLYFSTISAAFSLSVHYIGIASVVFPLYAIFKNRKDIGIKLFFKLTGLYTVVAFVFYALNYKGFVFMIGDALKYYSNSNFASLMPIGMFERFYYMFRDYFSIDPVFSVLFIITLIFGFKFLFKNVYLKYVMTGLIFYYLLLITIIAAPEMPRWLLIFVTLLVPLSAGFFTKTLLRFKVKKPLIVLLQGVIVLPSIIITINWLGLLNDNTYFDAETWLKNNLKDHEVVYSFDPVVYSDPAYDTAIFDKSRNGLESKKNNYILSQKDAFETNNFTLYYDRNHGRYTDLSGPDTDYVVLGSNFEKDLPELEKYHQLELVKEFKPTENEGIIENGIDSEYLNSPLDWQTIMKLDKSGPFIYIYKVL